jgi:hypothetical protein
MLINSKGQPLVFVVFASLFCLAGCNGGSTNTAPSANESPTAQSSPTAAITGFEADLDYIRKGGYTYIWVFSRADGKPLDKEDGAFLRKNAPQVVDWVTTDEGRKVIAGTNFDLAQGNLGLIKKRFVAEDYTGR